MLNYLKSTTLAVVILISACKNQPETASNTITSLSTQKSQVSIQPKDLIGIWVSAKYLADIQHSHSMRMAFDSIETLTVMDIKEGDMLGDTQRVSLSFGGHEGGEGMIVFAPFKSSKGITFGISSGDNPPILDNPKALIVHKDTITLQGIDDKNNITDASTYIRYTAGDLDNILEQVGIQTLFKGDWTLTDDEGKISSVKITEKGDLKGFGSYKSIGLYSDYSGVDFDCDMAYLTENTTKKPRVLCFKHTGNSVEFHEMGARKNKVVYKLVKK